MTPGRATVEALALVAALLVLAVRSSASVAQPEESCACLELERGVEGLSAMSRMDWEPLERSRFAEMWPTAMASCEPWRDELFVEEEFYTVCCGSCGTCGGQLLVEGFDSSLVSLRAMGAVVCRGTEVEARRDLARLVESAIPESVNSLHERVQENDSVVDTYRWDSRDENFLLTSRVFEWQQWWMGRTEVIRCETWDFAETWFLDDGSEVDILDITIDPEDEDERWVHLDYVTRCVLATQTSCVESEVHLVWRRLMAVLDLADVDVVSIFAQGCGSHHQTTLTKRNGEWAVVR